MITFFTDPILRGPTIGCMLMCLTCSLVGVITFIRKESLLGETISHATYPGIMLGALVIALTSCSSFLIWGLLGAALSSVLALLLLSFSKKVLLMKKDTALCFVLTLFFGIGLTFSSYLQNTNSSVYKQARVFLFGQAATITDSYLYLYFVLALAIILLIVLFYKPIQIVNLDPIFAKSVGINPRLVEGMCYLMLVASVIIGIRSIGLFLLSGMLIGPAIAARQWTHKLDRMFVLAGLIGLLNGFIGIYVSVRFSDFTKGELSLATGPTILVISALISIFSLVFAPKRGWFVRYFRILKFKKRCFEENILKSLWHFKQKGCENPIENEVFEFQGISILVFYLLLTYLDLKGDLLKVNGKLHLTNKGQQRAAHIVRMHRLWELYLVNIGVGKEKVHHNAEEMEHIITPEIEKQLLKMMKNPTHDPHNKPIPTGGFS